MDEKIGDGFLRLYVGPMYAGKSSRLLADLTTLADIGHTVLFINHISDVRTTRGNDVFSTHSSHFTKMSENITSVKVENLSHIDVSTFDVIGIDECQFFDDLRETVKGWVNVERKTIICSGLDGDAFMEEFGQTLRLIPLADEVIKLHARCLKCLDEKRGTNLMGIPAPFTIRVSRERDQKIVGGSEIYVPVCRHHHLIYNR